MTKTIRFFIAVFLTVFVLHFYSEVAQASDSEMNFDEIVDSLTRSRTSARGAKSSSDDPFDEIQIHLGMGVTNGVFSVQNSDGTSTQASQRGFQVNLGIDLFSPNLVAEGGIMSYMEREYDHSTIGLQEFNLKLFYKDFLE